MPLAGTQLTIPQAADYARQAGFSGNNLITMLAVAMGESDLFTQAINPTDPNNGSFGILQINGIHFGNRFGPNGQYTMSQAAAFDPQLAFLFSYELSNSGTNFSPWGAYTNLSYLQHIAAVKQALGSSGGSSTGAQFPPYTGTPWYNYDIKSDYGYQGSTYNNTDVQTPMDTPITAPLSGTITDIGYFDWGGQVTWAVDTPGAINGHKDAFVIHLDAINPNLRVGQHISQGAFLGYSGGQYPGEFAANQYPALPAGLTHHDTQRSHSTGPHLDIGATDSPYGSTTPDKGASDALVLLARSLRIGYGTDAGLGGAGTAIANDPQPGAGDYVDSLPYQVHNTLVQYPGFFGIAAAIDEGERFPGFINKIPVIDSLSLNDFKEIGEIPGGFLQSVTDTIIGNSIPLVVRGVLILAGLFLILALLWQLAKPNLEALPELAKLAVLA
jgi:hypothetical protein